MMTLDRWATLSRREQLLSIAAEFERARAWQGKDEALFKAALERALALIDLALQVKLESEELRQFLILRSEVARFYVGERADNVAVLSRAL